MNTPEESLSQVAWLLAWMWLAEVEGRQQGGEGKLSRVLAGHTSHSE